ncbi:MAG TPA: tetratricopeptide repeat protein [bacterium]
MLFKKQNAFYAAIAIALFTVAAYVYVDHRHEESRIPNISKRSGDLGAASEILNLQKAVEFYRTEIRLNPDLIKNYVELAQLYIQEARVTGRHHEYVAHADQLLDEALRRSPDNAEAAMTKAGLLLTMHRFEEAKKLAEFAVKRNAYSAFAWGALCDAEKELGNYSAAVRACDKMLSLRPDLRSYSRAAHLREIHGDLPAARAAMKLACDAGVTGQENRAWALYQFANLFLKEGKIDTAEFIYKGLLEERSNYPYALAGLADVHSARGQFNEAIQLLLRAYDLTPEHTFMEKLVDVYRATGQTRKSEILAESVLEAFKQHEEQGWNVNLEYALFCANHDLQLGEALRRIEQEIKIRPDNIDVQEAHAWVLYKLGRADDAMAAIEKPLQMNTANAMLLCRAGMIAKKMGDFDKAKNYIEAALKINPYLSLSEIQLAKRVLNGINPS